MASESQDRKLQDLFEAYRAACPDAVEGSTFMPGLWQKIEARQSFPFTMRRFAQFFVSAAAAMCLLMAVLLTTASSSHNGPGVMAYVEALDNDNAHEILAYADIENVSVGDNSW
ncbi:MAG: hypothetical protein JNK48_32650 [Bryobacterales bacterium]|nr:hypothetical protein [Bryobacterales bacterium]